MPSQVDKIIKELDETIESLDDPNFNIFKVAKTIQRTCNFLSQLITQNNNARDELNKYIKDTERIVDHLTEENETLQIDIQIILEFLKENNIDLSYIVTKSQKAKKPKGKK